MPEEIKSITIVRAEDLPRSVREEEGISTGFVEIKVTRNSPAQTKIIKLDKTPLQKMREAFKQESCLGIRL